MPTALLSVFDKNGIVPLAMGLKDLGWRLLATGGTMKALLDAGLEAQEVADYTGALECFDGRVKTLHPKIHGGLLFRRELAAHVSDAQMLDIEPIDLVVVNLYPFEDAIADENAGFEDCIEQIDIGGPSMLRSAAKNHVSVTVLIDPSQYEAFLEKSKAGAWGETDRRICALEVFRRTFAYDAAISAWLEKQSPNLGGNGLPIELSLALESRQALRYGENPHQPAGFYIQPGARPHGIAACEQLQGKELSYNNLLDSDAAAKAVWQFGDAACVIVKHNNPCGVGLGGSPEEAFSKALECDPMSAYGGIVAFNRPLGGEAAKAMLASFWEVILAPGLDEEAAEIFSAKKQLRLLRTPHGGPAMADELDIRSVGGGFLVQRLDAALAPVGDWEIKAEGRAPRPPDRDLFLAQAAAKAVKSNAIVLAKDGGTVGIGAGQMSRLDSVEIACRKAGDRARGAVLGSDAFFPFADSIELAAGHGVEAFIEPGGSIRDFEVIEAAQRLGVWLFFTGTRHFKH
jgi:phosphoribosylaminoimidazolecarboxamide formyltransferase/IMP cyclohydrolase